MKGFQVFTVTVAAASILAYSMWKASFISRAESQLKDHDRYLCFREAFTALARSELSEGEYFSPLLAHLQGIRHVGDTLNNKTAARNVPRSDYLAHSLRKVALRDDYEPVKDISSYQRLLERCSTGDITTVDSILDDLKTKRGQPSIIQPLAILAVRTGQATILDLCLSRGAVSDHDLDQTIRNSLQTSSMVEVLWSHNWHGIQKSTESLNELAQRSIQQEEVLLWFVEHGATLDLNTYKKAAFGSVSVPVMKIMADKYGPEPLRHTGSLQIAAHHGRADLVGYLLEIGIDPNEIPPPIDAREPLWTALHEAVINKHFMVVQVLVKHGANVDHPSRTRSAILAMAREYGDNDLIEHINSIEELDWKKKPT